MNLTCKSISVPTPISRNEKGYGWVKVHVTFTEHDLEIWPSMEIKVPVVFEATDSYDATRRKALDGAREILKAAVSGLDGVSIDDLPEQKPNEWL